MSDGEELSRMAVAVARIEERQVAEHNLVKEQLGTIKAALLGNGGPGLLVRMGKMENRYAKGLGYALGVSAVVSLLFGFVMSWWRIK